MPNVPTRDLRSLTHRYGVARRLSSTGNNWNDSASAYVETLAPRWLGSLLWRYALRGSWPPVDWATVHVTRVERPSLMRLRWHVDYRRARP